MSDIKYTQLFINNEFVNSVSGKTFPTINPSTGEKIVDVQEGDKVDIDKAVAAARAAFVPGSAWRTMDPGARSNILFKWADLIEKNSKELARIEALDNGKSFAAAQGDFGFGVTIVRYYAGWVDKINGSVVPSDPTKFRYTRSEPLGVAGIIVPWNFPGCIFLFKVACALAAGCTVVAKPAEQTPLTALMLAALGKEAGLPAGVLNVVPGFGPTAGATLSSHADVDKVAFTGSTEVGHLIMEAAAKSNLKRVTLELGGKSPFIILEDADVELAAKVAHNAIMFNSGQVCCAATRTFVQEKIYDKFVARCAELAKEREALAGDPFDAKTVHTAQIDDVQFKKILQYIELGKQEGAQLVAGGGRIGDKGYYVQPTVFAGVEDKMTIAREEIFGPVQSVLRFKTIDEAIERANKTRFGLAAGVFTNDINKALAIAHRLEAGTVWINTWGSTSPILPFGGFKESGFGRDWGRESLDGYLNVKAVEVTLHTPLAQA